MCMVQTSAINNLTVGHKVPPVTMYLTNCDIINQ